jgi:peptidoglycan/LPS O-acetylase OafA/YrhL
MNSRLIQIDALRGLAAVLVVVAHSSEYFTSRALSLGHGAGFDTLVRTFDFGRIGVVLFFMVSGFVVANTLNAPDTQLRHFLARRFFRLYPLYWFSMLLAYFFWTSPQPDTATIMANLTMFPSLWSAKALLGLYWTLEVELVFYLLAVLLMLHGSLFKPAVLARASLVLWAVFAAVMFGLLPSPSTLEWKSFPYNLMYMLFGVLWFNTSRQGSQTSSWGRAMFWGTLLLLMTPPMFSLLKYASSHSADDLRLGLSYPLAVAIFGAIYYAKAKWFGALAKLGVISYSMYLMHLFVLVFAARFVTPEVLPQAWLTLPTHVMLCLGLTVLFSTLTYNLVERPWIAFAKRFK